MDRGFRGFVQPLKKNNIPQQNINAISVSGQQHGLVALDAEGNLTRKNSKLWNDFSTQEECYLLTEAVGGVDNMIAEVGNSQRPGYTASKIYHFYRNDPEAYAKTSTLFLVHNFINWYLTGGKSGGVRVMEPGDTSGMALWNPQTKQWSQKVINAIAPDLMNNFQKLTHLMKVLVILDKTLLNSLDSIPIVKLMLEVVIIC